MEVSQAVKTAYTTNSIKKHLVIEFPDLQTPYTVPENDVYQESMTLSEQLSDSQSIEFVGCISSKFTVSIRDFGVDIKGAKIKVSIYTDGTEYEPVPLFCGIVEEAKLQSNHKIKEIVAYDFLYSKGNKDVSDWYKGLRFPKNGLSISAIRKSLFQYLELDYIDTVLPNDSVLIKKQYNPSSLPAIDVIKSICQINGVFGMMDRGVISGPGVIVRDSYFKFLTLPTTSEVESGTYPSLTLYPPFYPSVERSGPEVDSVSSYRTLEYQEFNVKPVDRLTIRQDSEDEGVTVPQGVTQGNRYIIQGNMFTLGLSKKKLKEMALAILPYIQGISYIPYTGNNDGFPWVECGETAVSYLVYDFENSPRITYTEASPEGTENPYLKRWYEYVNAEYVRSTDTQVNPLKTYYIQNEVDVYKRKQFYILGRNMSGIQALRDEYNAEGEEYQKEFVTDIGLSIDLKIKKVTTQIEQNIEENYYTKEEINELIEQSGGGTSGWSVQSVSSLPAQGQPNVLYLVQGEVVVN